MNRITLQGTEHRTGRVSRPVLCVFAALCLCCAGCGSTPRALPTPGTDPYRTIGVFNDGFHSGLLLPWPDPALAALDQRSDDGAAKLPWLEVGFGADAWARLGGGCCIAMRLSIGSSDAVLMLRHLPDMSPPPRAEGERPQVWKLQLDRTAWADLLARVDADINHDLSYPRRPGVTDWVMFSRPRWSIFNNCHDWTASTLAGFGLELADHTLRTAGNFTADMEAAQHALDEAGIRVIGGRQGTKR